MPDRIGVAGRIQLVLDATGVGFVKSIDGGSPVAAVVSEKAETLIPKKQIAAVMAQLYCERMELHLSDKAPM